MKRVFEICVLLTLISMSYLAVYCVLFLRGLSPVVAHLDTALVSVQAIEVNTTRTEAELSGLLNQTRHIAEDEHKAQTQQLAQIQQLNSRAIALLGDADTGVKQFTASMQSLGMIAPTVNSSVIRLTDESTKLMDSSNKMIQSATTTISDPSIHEAIDATSQAAQNTATATKNLADTSQDIKDYVHRETTPVRGTWNAIKAFIGLVWSIRGAAGI